MAQTNGFMFSAKLTAGPVNNNGTVAIMSADASDPNLDKVNWEVAANGYVYVDPAVGVQFGSNFVNVTNRTGISWPQHSEVALCAPYLSTDMDLSPRVAALETQSTDHETRITTNRTDLTDHENRIATLESAADPSLLPA
jgi:hypothetical protein